MALAGNYATIMADKKLGNQDVAGALVRLTGRNRHWSLWVTQN